MKDLIKKIIPQKLLEFYRKMKQPAVKYNKEESVFLGKTVKDTFTEIYKTNHWGSEDSISGSGSDNGRAYLRWMGRGLTIDNGQ